MSLKKVSFHTLGCKLNFSETSTIARLFECDGGYERVSSSEHADIHVINSCSVTDNSDKKCRALIRKIVKNDPSAIVAVTGCYAQLKGSEVAAIEGVDIVVDNQNKGELYNKITQMVTKADKGVLHGCESKEITSFFSAFSSGDRTRSFLKVQDGCSYHCSYCTIPLARGESRNIPISELVKQAKQVADKGIKEIVITGVNSGDFGRTTGETFLQLLQELNKVDGIERYRISSIEPNLLSEDILQLCADSTKFQPHFHIPLQAGSDKILALMRRRYTTADFEAKIAKVREIMGDVFLGIDVIVGFPGESEVEFNQTVELLKRIRPAFIHVFPYSERANTPSVEFKGKVSTQEKNRRVGVLTDLCHKMHNEYCRNYIGKSVNVLIEGTKKGGLMYGHSENYIKVEMAYNRELQNKIVNVIIDSVDSDTVATVHIK